MTKSLTMARQAMDVIVANLPATTLSRTSYAVTVVKLQNGNRAALITEAGAKTNGINGPLLDKIDRALGGIAVLGGADAVPGLGTWHMNDAEQQALRVLDKATGALAGARLKAIVANRAICASCAHTLRSAGFTVSGATASMPNDA